MPRKKGTLPPLKSDHLVLRAIGATPGVSDVVVATETPVRRYDEDRGYVINEVLLMEGVVLRTGQQQLPIVDSHDDTTVRNILGSIRNLRVSGGELHGEPVFASDPDAQLIRQRMDEGHITDFSITALPLESLFVPNGQTYTTSRGAIIEGPAVIHTRWQPHNASICATGADELSTVRRSYTDLDRKVTRTMDEALLKALSDMGMPAGLTDPSQILAWVCGKMGGAASATPVTVVEEPVELMTPPEEEDEEMADDELPTPDDKKAVTDAVARALQADGKRRKEIQALCEVHKIERAFSDSLCDDGVDIDTARAKVLERMATKPVGQSSDRVSVTDSADDKTFAAARDGLIMRTLRQAGKRTLQSPAAGHEDFANMKLSRMAEMYATKLGCDVRRMAPKDIALVAMGHPGTANRFRIQRDAYHTTGSFANLLLDAANKTLLAGYEEAPFTWEMWARNAGTTSDFKALNRIRFSEMGVPEMVPEGNDYPDSPMSDARETYKINKYGNMFTITWETVVNDDLDAISRIPAMQGAACRRLQNQSVYGVLTANAAMADTGLLFNSTAQTTAGGHANLTTGAGTPTVATLNTAFVSMMTKKGLKTGATDPILNIQPAFLIVPAALSATALQLLGSIADPAAGGTTAGNSNTKNIYGPNGDRPLKVIVEPLLDANSATAWYLAANNSQVDTVEITFLEGEQSPVLENEWDFDKDVYKYKVRQTFGVAAIDYRGLYKHAGA